jgi:hypothetical protein
MVSFLQVLRLDLFLLYRMHRASQAPCFRPSLAIVWISICTRIVRRTQRALNLIHPKYSSVLFQNILNIRYLEIRERCVVERYILVLRSTHPVLISSHPTPELCPDFGHSQRPPDLTSPRLIASPLFFSPVIGMMDSHGISPNDMQKGN